MKMLFIDPRLPYHMAGYTHMLWMEEVAMQCPDCKLAGPGFPEGVKGFRYNIPNETEQETLNRLYPNDDPDWVVGGFVKGERINRTYKLTRWLEDMHVNTGIFAEVSNTGLDALIMRCLHTSYMFPSLKDFRAIFGVPFHKWLETENCVKVDEDFITRDLDIPVIFMPISVSPDVFKPIDESQKKYDISLIASVGCFYPLRQVIQAGLNEMIKENKYNILLKNPPGTGIYRRDCRLIQKDPKLREQWCVRDDYAKAVAASKIFIFGSSPFRYPVTKYFEGMMSGSLVMADLPFHAKELHLKPDWNMVEINKDNWKEKVEYYLEDDQLRETIARRGYETAMKYHTHKIRAKEFLDAMEKIK